MKKILQIITACAAILFSVNSFGQRYVSEVFSSVDSTRNIVYGYNYSFLSGSGVIQPLVFDLYTPAGDTVDSRPLVIMIHTGSFLPAIINQTPTGSMRDSATSEMCRRFARRGYVVASMDYRTGWNPGATGAAGQDIRTGTLLQAVGRAIQDARACVRYFKKDFSNGNNYGIDTSKIILGGQGSGGYVAFAATTIDDTLEVWKQKFLANTDDPTYGFVAGACYWLSFIWGDFDGNGGVDTLNIDTNSVGYSSQVAMMFNLGGAMGDISWLSAGDVPMLAFHVVGDPFAPYDSGMVVVPTTFDPVVFVYGSKRVMTEATQYGNNDDFNSFPYGDSFTSRADAINGGIDGLFPFYMAGPSQVQAGPWEWFDSATVVNAAIAYGLGSAAGDTIWAHALLTNPDMSKAKAMAYIDTIMGYACPRISKALGLGVGMNDPNPLQHIFSVYPNPTSSSAWIRMDEGIKEEVIDLKITDIEGRSIATIHWNSSQSKILNLDLKNYSKGIYVIEAVSKTNSSKQKLVIQ